MFINGQDSTNNLHGKNTLFWNPTAPENENEIDQQHLHTNVYFIINQSNLVSLSCIFFCAIVFIIHQINFFQSADNHKDFHESAL